MIRVVNGIISIAMVLLGAVFIPLGVGMFQVKTAGWLEVTGTVVSIGTEQYGDSNTVESYRAYYEYTVEDKVYSISENTGSSKPLIGDTVTIYYDPEDPGFASTVRNSMRWTGVEIIGAGIALILWGLLREWKARKARQLQASAALSNPEATIEPE